jgi:hypothetical protein
MQKDVREAYSLIEKDIGAELASKRSRHVQADKAKDLASRALGKISHNISKTEEKISMIKRQIEEATDPEKIALLKKKLESAEKTRSGLDDALQSQINTVREKERLLNQLNIELSELGALNKAVTEKDFKTVIEMTKLNPDIALKYPSLARSLSKLTNVGGDMELISNALSKNLGNDRKFVKEYLKKIHPFVGKSAYSDAWMANPQNAAKLEEMLRSRKFGKYLELESGSKSARESLSKLNRMHLAKTLGVSAASIGAVGAPALMMDWFDDNSEDLSERSQEVSEQASKFRAVGVGLKVLEETMAAAEKIRKAEEEARSTMERDPAAATQKYVDTLIDQKSIIDRNLKKWDYVVRSSDNPQGAQQAKVAFEQLSKHVDEELAKASDIAEGKADGLAGDVSGLNKDNVKAIQDYIKGRFTGAGISPTGVLDRPTLQALKQLQREYDRLGDTGGRISQKGIIINEKEGHLIMLDDLKKLDQLIRK